MVSGHNATSSTLNYGFHNWKSPVPYLFGALAAMLGLIMIALIILACSYRNYPGSRPSGNDVDDPEKPPSSDLLRPEMEPRVVVIMAGDHNPTYLAKPTASSICLSDQVWEDIIWLINNPTY